MYVHVHVRICIVLKCYINVHMYIFLSRSMLYVQVVFSSGGGPCVYGEVHEPPPQRNR